MTPKKLAKAYSTGPYVWPGGYPQYLMLSDGEFLCWKCFKDEYKNILDALKRKDKSSGWFPEEMTVLYEGIEFCANCGEKLETAYED